MKRYSRILLWAILIGIPFLVISTGVMVKITEKPKFCSTCHIMRPYYRAWKTSTHNEVPCIECHYPPDILSTIEGKFKALSQIAKYVTRTEGTRPWAEIPDASCLRSECHERRLLDGKIQFGDIEFDHTPHLLQLRRGKQLRCTSCHSQIVMGSHMTVTPTTCFTCHFKNVPEGEAIGGCTSCHSVPEGIIEVNGVEFDHSAYRERGVECSKCHVSVTRGDGAVPTIRCLSCHAEPERLQRYNDTDFIHQNHVTAHKVECYECHQEIQHGAFSMADSITPDCESCHRNTHSAQRDLYLGVGGRGVAGMPSAMQLGNVDCRGCHILNKKSDEDDFKGDTLLAAPIACMHCHGADFDGMLEDWQEHMTEGIASLEKKLASAEKARKKWKLTGEALADADELFAEAVHNFKLVKNGNGTHNIPYAVELMKFSKEAFDILESPREDVLIAFFEQSKNPKTPAKSCTSACHLVPPDETISYQGKQFPHNRHNNIQGAYCTFCHYEEKDTHGLTYTKPQDCSDCHHARDTGTDCTGCHADDLSSPKTVSGMKFSHDLHSGKNRILCQACHKLDSTSGSYSFSQSCSNCHHEESGANCGTCHSDIEDTLGEGMMPFDCTDCHETGSDTFATPEGCDLCHSDQADSMNSHEDQRCSACHVQHTWMPEIPDTCLGCHELNQDHIDGEMTDACDACHLPHD